jgi:metallo-beta-lactamase family protein
MRIQFLGAARQVTGSRYLVEAGGLKLLVDCGLFQERDYLERNWTPCPVPPGELDYLLLTHAHLDHAGLIPRLVHEGFNKPIVATPATRDLAEIVLDDAARIQEEDAAYKAKRHKREGRTDARPPQPLYTPADVAPAMKLFRPARYGEPLRLSDGVTVAYHDAGHILGSAMLELRVRRNGATRTLIFSGDIGADDRPIVRDPTRFDRADYVVMESTYGARNHEEAGPVDEQLAGIINATAEAGGNVIIPTFAIERAQELMYHIGRLVREERIPRLLVFLDSPMAVDVTEVFRRHRECMDQQTQALFDSGEPPLRFPGLRMVQTTTESKAINRIRGSCIIMAGSGMCTAGRVKHHLVTNLPRPESSVVFVGYQAAGTLGRQIADGNEQVRIHGVHRPVRARVAQVNGLSAHADQSGLMAWLTALRDPPRRVFLTHGEEEAGRTLTGLIRARWGEIAFMPKYEESFELD